MHAHRRRLEEDYNAIKKPKPAKTFSVAAKETLEAIRPKLCKSTIDIHERGVSHLIPFVGKKLLPAIDMQDIEAVRADRRAHGASNRYINMTIDTLRHVLIRNNQWEHLRKDYKKLKERETAGKALSQEEEEKLLAECRASASRVLAPAVTLSLYTGMRRDEVRLLRWSQIDLRKACLTVGHSKTPDGEGRLIPLIGAALEAMREWAAQFPNKHPNHFIFPNEKYALNAETKKIRIYKNDPEKPMGSWKRAWTSARRRAGIQVRFHDLRHTTVTRLVDAGCTLEQIAPILGWSDRTMAAMMKRYQHRSLEKRRETMLNLVTRRGDGSSDEISALLNLLRGNTMDISIVSAIAEIIDKRLENLRRLQTSES